MKKIHLLLLVFVLSLPAALADITLQPNQNAYNLGNRISASASVLQDKDFEGLFRLAISCSSYKLGYFLTPASLEANFRTAIIIPELTATFQMLGNCSLTGDLMTNDNLILEEKESSAFGITDQLKVLPVRNRITALPSDLISLVGVVNEAFGNNILKASVKITLDNGTYEAEAVDGKFNLTLELPKNIKSKKHIIGISAFDSKGNSGDSFVELDVTAVPSHVQLGLSKTELSPGSNVEITASLYDQADDLINDSLSLELQAPGAKNIFKKTVRSNEKIVYEFSQYAEPGVYVLTGAYRSLMAKATITLSPMREVRIRYENESVFVENTGNIPFEDELTFILESGLKKYPLTKKISIEPGKLLSIDLSKEVPLGIYDILVGMKEGIKPFGMELNESLQSFKDGISLFEGRESMLADNVQIQDNRPVYKKLRGSFSSVSAALVGADGYMTKNPLIAPIALVAILLLLVFRYGRKPIMRLIKGKKKEPENKEKEK